MEVTDYTVRLKLVGEELRRYREGAGLTLAQVGRRTGIHTTQLSKMETGKYRHKCEDMGALLAIYGVVGEERKLLLELARAADEPGFVQRHHSPLSKRIAALKILEERAIKLINFENQLIPGLLQTIPYAQAAMRTVGLIKEQVIDDRVAARVQRQGVLRKPRAPQYTAIISEGALHNVIGDRRIMRDQLIFLTEASRRQNVSIRIIPLSMGGHPGLEEPFVRMQFADRPAIIVVPNRTCNVYLERDEDLSIYDTALVELLTVALNDEESVALVARLAATLE